MSEQMTAERLARLVTILGAAHYNGNGIATISRETVGEICLTLKDAQAEIDAKDRRIAELEAEVKLIRPGHEAARVAGWSTVWDLQTKHVNTWRDKAEWYWFARFSEEVGELGGALAGNHVGPVEWELSQIAAIALNWLDMRAATERRRDE